MPDFRSDTVTRPTPAMRDAMATAPLGDDVFGDDPSVNALQQEAADALGFADALFVPSGTQSNLIALMSHCERGDEVILGQQAHTYRWEAGGMAVLGSIQPQPLEHRPDGTLNPALIAAAIKPDDAHFARTRLVALENTIGGKVLPPDYPAEVAQIAKAAGLAMHLDGARLFNAAVAQTAPADGPAPSRAAVVDAARAICRSFDSVSVCLSKGLGAPVGSLLLGSRPFIARARRHRKMLGGGLRQAGVLAAAGRHALAHHLVRLHDDHRHAIALATGLRRAAQGNGALAGRLRVVDPQTNMVFVEVDRGIGGALARHLADAAIQVTGAERGDVLLQRWVTHLDVDAADVETVVAALERFEG